MEDDKKRLIILAVILLAVVLAVGGYGLTHSLDVLDTKGIVGQREKHLIILSSLLMLIVVIPVYFLTFFITWKYRAGNKKARYEPDQDGNRLIEVTWWAIPGVIILILSVVAWNSAHSLDPFRPLGQSKQLTVQVVALPWKWLFIYPAQNVAALNELAIPVDTDVDFNITSDAPMNSFWVPRLGGQIYAMAGMNTHLHLQADQPGDYEGVSANISGQGFAGMHFKVKAMSQTAFVGWSKQTAAANHDLTQTAYDNLAKPSQNDPVAYYSTVEPALFDKILLKYALPSGALVGADVNSLQTELHHHE